MPQKMKILAIAITSTFKCQRKYLRWHLKVCSFFGAVIKTPDLISILPYINKANTKRENKHSA